MTRRSTASIHTDGASRGNPGDAAFAYVIGRDGMPPIEEAGCLGQMTNNQAEYTAVVRALERALELDPTLHYVLHSDSELLVKQMKGEYRVKSEELRSLYEKAQELVGRLHGGVTFKHVRRALNARADALCNEALDGKWKPRPHSPAEARHPSGTACPPSPGESLRDDLLVLLESVADLWRSGASDPTPEEICDNILRLVGKQSPGPIH